jgi:hypothetical protein
MSSSELHGPLILADLSVLLGVLLSLKEDSEAEESEEEVEHMFIVSILIKITKSELQRRGESLG